MNERFTWVETHFTIAESDIVETWRKHFPDDAIASYRSEGRGGFNHPTRAHDEVVAYLARNPRKPKDAA